MRDKTLIIEILEQLEQFIESLLDGTSQIEDFHRLPMSPKEMLILNGICMSFIVIGEEVKRINKYTEDQLLVNYPSIPWKRVMGMRDRIAHGYFQIDIDVVSDTLKNDIPPLLETIKQMKNDLLA
jgi:uncharacterized protein with HEPN domain